MTQKKLRILGFLTAFCLILQAQAFAEPFSNSIPSIIESKAFAQFKKRPVSELSKILYLIERFQTSDVEILYSGNYYKAPFAAIVVRYFLATQYKKESATDWIKLWANRSLKGKLIYVKYPDGKMRLAKEVLMEELRLLELALAQDALHLSPSANEPKPLLNLPLDEASRTTLPVVRG